MWIRGEQSLEGLEQSAYRYPFELGALLRFGLDEPCNMFVYDVRCEETEGYIEVNPFASTVRYEQICANGHYVRTVSRAEVELRLGIAHTPAQRSKHPLTPSRRVALNVILRDRSSCVYCGRSSGELGLDGTPVVIAPHHIIPAAAIDLQDLRYDSELRSFARDVQVVAACPAHGASKTVPDFEIASDIFIRCVLRGNTTGRNLGAVEILHRLHRLALRR